jgi:hypothetical protein
LQVCHCEREELDLRQVCRLLVAPANHASSSQQNTDSQDASAKKRRNDVRMFLVRLQMKRADIGNIFSLMRREYRIREQHESDQRENYADQN